jgi:hypothetical protein
MFETNVSDWIWPEKDRKKLQKALDKKVEHIWAFVPYGFDFAFVETTEVDERKENVWAMARFLKIGNGYVVKNVERYATFDYLIEQAKLISNGKFKTIDFRAAG